MAGLTYYPAAIHTHQQLSHDVDQRSISIYDATTDGEAVDDTSAAAPDTHHHRRRHHHHHRHRHHLLGNREGDGYDGDHEPSSAWPMPSPGRERKPADEATSDDDNNNHHHLGGVVGGNSLLLDPRPSTSADDPLNWSWAKKHAVLAALIPGCLLSDWTLTWGTAVFPMQAAEWYIP
ncbi:hypothetical protein MYCTH_2108297 [Thermothelomyces thermophilus ATCC 42464]|uniref:Uncharacterized protein n=1 Tax=Thermothelomyces thermophilus (strain ATCC 42464 / BCRC 31852 / DSM 1799) TaxID=573729 RepID=G2PZK0_THET4|nr:uncharacterized protein MYCTH_2108297 [Thermothelomyces thermophilus ATCC 42464]AEO55686.1 hypothetical protein MYCTH_2108297 [Thermothelomyces thermophilus ATCC 42464]